MAMKRSLLRFGLRRSAYGRFLADTFYTPTLYSALKRSISSLGELEEILLPLLLPTQTQRSGSSSGQRSLDLAELESNIRFRSWARDVFLTHKYAACPTLARAVAALDASPEPYDLAVVKELFELGGWDRNPVLTENAPQLELVSQYKSGDSAVEAWTLEQALECIGCVVVGLNSFNLYCEQNGIFELFTRDYIDALSDHIIASASHARDKFARDQIGEAVRVLEVGAGTGKLSAFLQQALNEKGHSEMIDIRATDSGTWRIKPQYDVEKMSYQRALTEYEPHIVLCSWMPSGDDWTAGFRNTPSVFEYVLIGEVDDGCCGHPWLTWGVSQQMAHIKDMSKKQSNPMPLDVFQWLGNQSEKARAKILAKYPYQIDARGRVLTPYIQDGFRRRDVKSATALQLCRYDRAHYACNSRTVSFTRKPKRGSNSDLL